jgi:hypothetical protein
MGPATQEAISRKMDVPGCPGQKHETLPEKKLRKKKPESMSGSSGRVPTQQTQDPGLKKKKQKPNNN